MEFNSKKIENPVTVLYGHRKGSKSFDAVMTLEHKEESTEIHGFLTRDCGNPNLCEHRESMNPWELIAMWKRIKEESRTKYIEFDVLADHARFYKQFLHVVNTYVTRTIDGHECEHLTVDMSKGIKHFKGDQHE